MVENSKTEGGFDMLIKFDKDNNSSSTNKKGIVFYFVKNIFPIFILVVTLLICVHRMIKLQTELNELKDHYNLQDTDRQNYVNGRYDYIHKPVQVYYEPYFDNIYDTDSAIVLFKNDDYKEIESGLRIEAAQELLRELIRFYGYSGNIKLEISSDMGQVEGMDEPIDITTYCNYGYFLIGDTEDSTIFINGEVMETDDPWCVVYAITHEFFHLYMHQLVSSVDTYYMNSNEAYLKDNHELCLIAQEMNAYEGKPEDIETWLRDNTPFCYTERIITEKTLSFIMSNKNLLLNK